MLVPNRHSSSDSYRYGFNGKELDNELKGDGNSYDFGARMLDVRIGRWFALDKEFSKLPELTPYGFVNNNPLSYIDPDGNFLIKVHKRIASNAFGRSKILETTKNYQILENYRRAIVGTGFFDGSVVAPDKRTLPTALGGDGWESFNHEHFDDMNYNQILSNFKDLNKGIKDGLGYYAKNMINEKQLGDGIGEIFHSVQDFYSHSNYIELYAKVYGQTKLSDIPTLQEAIASGNKPDATIKEAKFAKLLKNSLKTGKYPGEGAGSHKDLNHDLGRGGAPYGLLKEVRAKEVDWYSEAAEEVATKATTQINDKVETLIDKKIKK